MVFWILVAAVAAAGIGAILYWIIEEGEWILGFLIALMTAMIGGLVSAGIIALFMLIPAEHITSDTQPLRALGNNATLEGRFYFLGSGYINGAQQFSYIEQGDGYSMLLTADADASRVFENAKKPTVTTFTHSYSNGWVLPWSFDTGYTYDFHVPAGTVQTNYEVSTTK